MNPSIERIPSKDVGEVAFLAKANTSHPIFFLYKIKNIIYYKVTW